MWTEEQTFDTAGKVFGAFLSLGERAKLSKATLTELVGVSRARFTTLEKDSRLSLHAFLRTVKAIDAIKMGLDEGWLPASGARGPGQDKARDQLLERI